MTNRFTICTKTAEAVVEYLRGVGHTDAAASLEDVLRYWMPPQTEHVTTNPDRKADK
jgi:hypothetical protein